MSLNSKSDHNHSHSQNRFAVIPTSEKLGADPQYTGHGVRIAFLDSGFFPHPDFASRVVEFHDIADEESSFENIDVPQNHHWHGTQTVTACAGDGHLSEGVYRGLAHRSELVLVKVSRAGRVGDHEIESGLRWVLANRERLKIRTLNISLGGDCDLPTSKSRINGLVEELTENGVAVAVAAGNSAEMRSLPPASAPSAITVGGYSDENQLEDHFDLYHASYGETADGIVKPELIAPAMYVAAPILPGTKEFEIAEALSALNAAPDYNLASIFGESRQLMGYEQSQLGSDRESARRSTQKEIRDRKIVSTHYQHVDGTSFASPIVTSVVAQMLEANPRLSPAAVKNILTSSAKRLGGHPAIRQGYGIVNAPLAVEMAISESHSLDLSELHPPRIVGRKIVFKFHNDSGINVALAGDFNNWQPTPLIKCESGIWETAIGCKPAGRYRYKFLVDGNRWIEDPSHALKEDDGFGGFNSILLLA